MISTEKIQIVLQIFYCTTWHTQQHSVNNDLPQNLSSSSKMHPFIMPVFKKIRQKLLNHCILSIKKHRKAMCQNLERDSVTKPTNLYLVKRIVSHVKDNHILCYYCLIFIPKCTRAVEIQMIQSIRISRRLKEAKDLPKNNEGSCIDEEFSKNRIKSPTRVREANSPCRNLTWDLCCSLYL